MYFTLLMFIIYMSKLLAESLEVLMMVLEGLHEDAKPMRFKVTWVKAKIKVFRSLLNETL